MKRTAAQAHIGTKVNGVYTRKRDRFVTACPSPASERATKDTSVASRMPVIVIQQRVDSCQHEKGKRKPGNRKGKKRRDELSVNEETAGPNPAFASSTHVESNTGFHKSVSTKIHHREAKPR